MHALRSLIAELHRRSVWRVLGIYVAAGWVALEVASTLTESFGLPEWFPAFALGLLVIGLPVVLATTLVQEASVPPPGQSGATAPPQDRRVDAEASPAPGPEAGAAPGAGAVAGIETGPAAADAGPRAGTPPSRPRLHTLFTWRNAILGGLAAFALWGVLATAWILFGAPRDIAADESAAAPSVAVLPFENLSPDPDDAFFADGIHEEILTSLARIDALKVISRTSVLEYRDTQRNLREIADELGVESVLEGSVRRAGDRVRITAQLIDAERDTHLWAETFDRELRDVFQIQSEVAMRIADALHAELDPGERDRIAARPTSNMEAYDSYMRGGEYLAGGYRPEGLEAARRMYERAVELDPEYLEAHARLAFTHLITYWLGFDRVPERIEAARDIHGAMLGLASEDPATHYVDGYLRYYAEHDYAGAAESFLRAADAFPHEAQLAHAYVLRRLGRWDEHLRLLQAARELSPRDATIPYNLGETFLFLRRYDESVEHYRAAIAISPDWGRPYGLLARVHVLRGDVDAARATIEGAPAIVSEDLVVLESFRLAMAERDPSAALETLDRSGRSELVAQFVNAPVELLRGWALELAGADGAAAAAYEAAAVAARTALEDNPDDHRLWLALAFARAGLGERPEALEAAEEARRLYPMERDHAGGRDGLTELARLYARLGETDRALELIERLLAEPSPLSAHLLRLEPDWDGLRGDPRFQALLAT